MDSSSDVVFIGGMGGDLVDGGINGRSDGEGRSIERSFNPPSFGACSIYSHDGLIRPFDPLVDVHDDGNAICVVGSWYVDGYNVGWYFCRIVYCYFLSF